MRPSWSVGLFAQGQVPSSWPLSPPRRRAIIIIIIIIAVTVITSIKRRCCCCCWRPHGSTLQSRSLHVPSPMLPCPRSCPGTREGAGRGRRAYARLGRGISHSRVSSARLLEAVCMSETCLAWPCMSHFCRLRQVDPEDEVSACLSIPHDLRR